MDTKGKDWEVLRQKYPFIKCGIACGYGWYDILDKMFELVELWYQAYRPDELKDFVVIQIKEKYGTLSVYTGGSYEEVFDIISAEEIRSSITCEWCGAPGRMTEVSYWYRTLCNDCYKQLLKDRGIRELP